MAIRRRYIRSLIDQLLSSHGVENVPVDVRVLAEVMGAQVRKDDVADNLSGFLIRDVNNSRALIGVNGAQSPVRQRFTIAHELGHLLLHEGDQLHIDQREGIDLGLRMKRRDSESSLGLVEEEKEANLFAAELLMPFSFLERDVTEWKAKTASCEDEDIIKSLAERYDVSVQAMTFRLANLGLIYG